MGKPQATPVPDPTTTANAQSAADQKTAISQAELNNVNQITPNGNLTYQQTGTYSDGTPIFTATTSLTPLQQQANNSTQQAAAQLGQIGVGQLTNVANTMSTPFDPSNLPAMGDASSLQNDKVVQALTSQANMTLQPQFALQKQQFDQQMADQGIPQGSDAYNKQYQQMMLAQSNSENTAINQAQASGQAAQSQQVASQNATNAQALQEQTQLYNMPLNELNALFSSSQVTSPSFVSTPQTTVAPTDVIGATNLASQVAMNNATQQNTARSAVIGALGSAAGAAGGAAIMYSDRRLKMAIKKLGAINGINIYEYAYKWAPSVRRVGVMAQEILGIVPQAVISTPSGLMVDYGMLKPWLA